jgi:hypothetical protein
MPKVEELVKIEFFFSHKTSKSVTHLHDFTHMVCTTYSDKEHIAMGIYYM